MAFSHQLLFHSLAFAETFAALPPNFGAVLRGFFTTTSMARSKRAHASGNSFGIALEVRFAMRPPRNAPTHKEQDDAILYLRLMNETRHRLDEIDSILKVGPHSGITGGVNVESCFLQLRLISELIALACLIAHGDAPKIKRIEKEYAADKIIEFLDRLDPIFFPVPVMAAEAQKGVKVLLDLGKMVGSYVPTKKDIVKLYARCGNILHRGIFKQVSTGKPRETLNFREIAEWLVKLNNLLGYHWIERADKNSCFICTLRHPQHKHAWIDIGQAPDRDQPDQ